VDFQLAGLLIVAAAAAPYVIEILRQVPLLTRIIEALPPEERARMGRHPNNPRLGVFGSTRFFLKLFRHAVRSVPGDTPQLADLKRRARWSAVREGLFAVLLVTAVVVLWRQGWRPPPWSTL
jgi:hypothetical protein